MKLSGVEQEILISNGNFDKNEFRLFFMLYSNGTVWPKIWRNEKEKNKQEHLERRGILRFHLKKTYLLIYWRCLCWWCFIVSI